MGIVSGLLEKPVIYRNAVVNPHCSQTVHKSTLHELHSEFLSYDGCTLERYTELFYCRVHRRYKHILHRVAVYM